MSGSGQKKSLTEPPTNLKAVHWVLRVSGGDGKNETGGIKGLAKGLMKLLDKDAKDVVKGVLKLMGGSLTKVVEGLTKVDSVPMRGFRGFLSNVKTYFTTVSDYGTAVPEEQRITFVEWLEKDAQNGTGGPISAMADGLKKFIGYQANGKPDGKGIIKNGGSYKSAYDGKPWTEVETEKRICAKIFIGLAPLIFYLLPFLYWKCKLNDSDDGWKDKNLSQDPLKKFMASDAIGFSENELHDSKKGSEVADLIGNTCFKELETAYQQGKEETSKEDPYYATVIRHLEQSTTSEPSLSTSPLSCCFAIASPYFTPNETYIVETTSPAAPSFLGYSGTAALAGGAYAFNLGGLGTFVSTLLV
ncbi:uncharacterized protein BcabD6B2_42060 [Babesia caballi]|uniref:Uncharacterized protein n=1 Tax=Babesia caballi TaxID=5871 RepID=A0AAV4LX53_BABCB|nr:hypothetical protein, conserved [Babesia caballi]